MKGVVWLPSVGLLILAGCGDKATKNVRVGLSAAKISAPLGGATIESILPKDVRVMLSDDPIDQPGYFAMPLKLEIDGGPHDVSYMVQSINWTLRDKSGDELKSSALDYAMFGPAKGELDAPTGSCAI